MPLIKATALDAIAAERWLELAYTSLPIRVYKYTDLAQARALQTTLKSHHDLWSTISPRSQTVCMARVNVDAMVHGLPEKPAESTQTQQDKPAKPARRRPALRYEGQRMLAKFQSASDPTQVAHRHASEDRQPAGDGRLFLQGLHFQSPLLARRQDVASRCLTQATLETDRMITDERQNRQPCGTLMSVPLREKVDAVRSYAETHHHQRGWALIDRSLDDRDIADHVCRCWSPTGAIRKMARLALQRERAGRKQLLLSFS